MQKERLRSIVLEQIKKGEIRRPAAAEILEVSERHVNRLMKANGVRKPRGQVAAYRRKRTEAWSKKREACLKYARLALRQKMSVENAAKLAGVSKRALYRWIAEVKSTENL